MYRPTKQVYTNLNSEKMFCLFSVSLALGFNNAIPAVLVEINSAL
jgi:hypothetical protein